MSREQRREQSFAHARVRASDDDDATHGAMTDTGGDVGTNGNLSITGHADVGGKLYTPRTGVGACTKSLSRSPLRVTASDHGCGCVRE